MKCQRGVRVGLGYGEHIGQCLVYIHVIFIYINITIKQLFKLYIIVLGVNILPLDGPCKIPEVYKAPRL